MAEKQRGVWKTEVRGLNIIRERIKNEVEQVIWVVRETKSHSQIKINRYHGGGHDILLVLVSIQQ